MVIQRLNQWLTKVCVIPLHTLLIVPFVLQILGVVGIVGYLSYRSGQQAVDELAKQLIFERGDKITKNIKYYLHTPNEITQMNAQAIRLGILDWQNLSKIEDYFIEQLKISTQMSSVYILTEQKKFLIVAQPQSDSLVIREWNSRTGNLENYVADWQGNRLYLQNITPNYDPHHDPPDEPWYPAAKAAQNGTWLTVVSTVRKGEFILVLMRSIPFYDSQGNLRGVVGATIFLERLGEFIRQLKVGKTGQAFIVNEQGFLIATSTDEKPFRQSKNMPENAVLSPKKWHFTPQDSENSVTQAVSQLILKNFGSFNAIDQAIDLKLKHINQYYYVRVIPYSIDKNSNWFVVVTIPESDLIGQIKTNVYSTILLCFISLIVSIFCGIFTTRLILKPLKNLNLFSQKISHNNFEQPLEKTWIREVNQLADSFHHMAHQLNRFFQALKMSEQRFSTLLDSVPIGISVLDHTGQHLLINQVGEKILGQGLKEHIPEQFSEVYQIYIAGTTQLYPPEKLPGIRALKGETIHVCDLEIQVNNCRIPLEVTSVPVFDQFGIVRYSLVAYQDITERQQNEQLRLNYQQQLEQEIIKQTEELKKSEDRLKLVIDATLDGIWDWDLTTNQSWWSEKIYTLLKLEPTEHQKNSCELIDQRIHPEDYAHFKQVLQQHLEFNSLYSIEFRLQRSDGSYGWFLCKGKALRNQNGEPYRMVGSLSDISTRKQAEELLYQSEARYLSILEYQTELITRFQADGTLTFVNDAYCRYFCLSKEQIIGHTYHPQIYPEDQAIIDDCLASLSPQQPVTTIEHRVMINHQVRWMQWTNQAIYDNQGNLVEFQSVGHDIDDRKQAEIALQTTNEQLQTFLDNTPTLISLFDIKGYYLRVNKAFANILNLSEQQIIGKSFADFFPPDIITIFEHRIQQLINTDKPLVIEDTLFIDGQLKTFESILFSVVNERGKPQTFWSVATDITARKQAEIELRKSRDLRDAIFHESADALFLVDSDSLLTIDCNRYAVELFEAQNQEELIGIEGHILQKRQFNNQEMEKIRQEVNQKGLWSLEIEYITKKGRYFWGNLTVKQVDVAEKKLNLVRVTDISNRKFAEQALRESEKQLRLLADALPVFISYADSEQRYQFVNKKYEEQFGLSREEILGKHTREVIGEVNYNFVCDYIEQALTGESVNYEVTFPSLGDSEERSLSVMLIPDFDESLKVQGYYSLIIDISDRKRIELELQKAKEAAEIASKAKGTFIANMSHELRSPLNSILGFARLLKNNNQLSSEQQKNAEIIYRSGKHLLNLINQVLDLAKIESNRTTLEQKDFNLYTLLDDIYSMFSLKAKSQGLAFNIQKTSDVPSYIQSDEMKLRQVLINLLSNAFKFTEKGSVSLRVFVSSDSLDQRVILNFEVEDTGIGIAPEEQINLFEAFIQTEAGRKINEGTGLGLTISREFVQVMGGELTVDSQLDRGSIFKFNIVAKIIDEVPKKSQIQHQKIIGLEPEQLLYRLLVVDDHSINRQLLVQLLTPLGFAIQEAENGAEAITLWQKWQPHLIWMDLRMPVLDGYQATAKIREQEQSQNVTNPVIIIALSANILPEKYLTLGFNDFIRKPFEELEIFTTLKQHLGVKYCYAKDIQKPDETLENTENYLEAFANLPDSILTQLEEALILGDPKLIQQTIQSLDKLNNHLAEALNSWADRFEYTQILDLIRSVR